MFFVVLSLLFVAVLNPAFGADEGAESIDDVSKMLGRFERYSIDNYDEYLEALGVNIVKRKALVAASPVLENRKSGDTWTTIISTSLKNWEYTYVSENLKKIPKKTTIFPMMA
jgi:hypothetical protein